MEINPRGSRPSIYLSLPQGGEKRLLKNRVKMASIHGIGKLSRNLQGPNLKVSFIFILYTHNTNFVKPQF